MRRRARQLILAAVLLAAIPLPLVLAAAAHPTAMDWRHVRFARSHAHEYRYEALAGREAEIRGRDAAWNRARTRTTPFSQGYRAGRSVKQQQCAALAAGHVEEAAALSSGPGEPVDVIVC